MRKENDIYINKIVTMKDRKKMRRVNILSKFSQVASIENYKPYVRQGLYRMPM